MTRRYGCRPWARKGARTSSAVVPQAASRSGLTSTTISQSAGRSSSSGTRLASTVPSAPSTSILMIRARRSSSSVTASVIGRPGTRSSAVCRSGSITLVAPRFPACGTNSRTSPGSAVTAHRTVRTWEKPFRSRLARSAAWVSGAGSTATTRPCGPTNCAASSE
ncbi:hypothetical protein O1L55_27805 [Streptomyces albulus]|nr:hypothetical protein [Streptomyces noursei]